MVEAQAMLETATVIAYMIIAAVIGYLIDTLLVLFERVLLKWRA